MRKRRHENIEPITITIPGNVLTTVPGTRTMIQHDGDHPASYRLVGGWHGILLIDISRHSDVRWFITVEAK